MSDQAAADALKLKGNEAYKARDFDKAVELYDQAWNTHKDITYLNNLAAVYFEQADYDKCIQTCEKAVDEGRDMRADYKLIAKAFGRIGTAYLKKDDFNNAIKFFNKSLTEHRTPDILAKLKDVRTNLSTFHDRPRSIREEQLLILILVSFGVLQAEKTKAERERLAYIDPAKADAARELGNTAFKSGDFAGSVAHYAESIKRNPSDARGYTNRAAALTKLLALPEALKDAEKAIEVQPDFVKGYIRKSHVLFAMKEYSKALAAIEQADAKDVDRKHTIEIASQFRKVNIADAQSRAGETDEQTYARAMRDPEIQSIMSDPAFQMILQQAQNDPPSLQAHMQRNEDVRVKVEKLVRAGIIKTGTR